MQNRVKFRILCIPTPHLYICVCAAAYHICCCALPSNCHMSAACPPSMQGLQSLEPSAISSFNAQLCSTTTNPAPSPTMCQQASLHHYTAGLQTATAPRQNTVQASTNKARHVAVTELTSWLQQLNLPNKSMQII